MKSTVTTYGRIFPLAVVVLLTALLLVISAKSAKVEGAPSSTSELCRSINSLRLPDANLGFWDDTNAEPYRLVFPTIVDGVFRKGKPDYTVAEYDSARPSFNNSLVEHLNEAGLQGYKLVSLTGGFPVAVVKLDKTQYEYAWFQTVGPPSMKSGFESKYSQFAKRGFHLFGDFVTSDDCENMDPDGPYLIQRCTVTDFFVVEREEGFKDAIQQRLAFAGPSFSMKTDDDLNAQIKDRLAEGYYPTKLLSKFEILLEQTGEKNERSTDQSDVRVVASAWRNNVQAKVNALAKQGYRLTLINNQIALMSRAPTNSTSTSYIWLDAKAKDFEKRMVQLQAQGAEYRMTYSEGEGKANKLIFESRSADIGKTQHEYRVLKFEFNETEIASEKKVRSDLTPESKENVKLMNRLAKEGFVVREVFNSDKGCLLLERSK